MPVPATTSFAFALRPEPAPARSWLERELSRPEYRRSWLDQFLSWVGDLWDSLQAAAREATSLSTGAAVLVLVVLVVLLTLVAGRVRHEPRAGAAGDGLLGLGPTSPEEHRARAEAALARGSHDVAVVEAFRTVAARAVRRGLLEERAGRTAHELAAQLGPLFPEHSAALQRASTLFDSVFYGDQPASQRDARWVLELDDGLRAARPGPAVAEPDRGSVAGARR